MWFHFFQHPILTRGRDHCKMLKSWRGGIWEKWLNNISNSAMNNPHDFKGNRGCLDAALGAGCAGVCSNLFEIHKNKWWRNLADSMDGKHKLPPNRKYDHFITLFLVLLFAYFCVLSVYRLSTTAQCIINLTYWWYMRISYFCIIFYSDPLLINTKITHNDRDHNIKVQSFLYGVSKTFFWSFCQ